MQTLVNRAMPNVNRRGRDRGGNYYKGNEHDDRVPLPQDGTRRVSFKNHGSGRHKNNRQRGWDKKLQVFLGDDVDMTANVRTNERTNAFHNKHRRDGDRFKSRQLNESISSWYKVIIRNGNKYPKDYLLKLLSNFIQPQPFFPIGYKIGKDESSFCVGDHETATQLNNADRKITAQDGWKLMVRVRPFTPMIELDHKLSAAMSAAMASRYNPAVKALNLKKFHADEALVAADLFVPLNRPNLMMAALDIIAESIPDLVALDLSDNKLNQIEHMKIMIEKCPHLKVLHIGDNRLRDIKQLDALKGLQLEELVLDGNALCNKFTSQEIYISPQRELGGGSVERVKLRLSYEGPPPTKEEDVCRVKKEAEGRVKKEAEDALDGTVLPPPILFDVEDEGTLPVSQASFMAAQEGVDMVRQFLEQYYQLYDGETSKEPLHMAYHDSAQFSYDVFVQTNDTAYSSMAQYMSESRNLLRITNLDRRTRNLKVGKASIIEALNNLPKSNHDRTSFIVDLVVFTPQLIQLNVCGLFNELGKKTILRAFSRVFIIVPVSGGGYTIVNDQLTISQPTQDQIKKVNLKKEAGIPPLMSVGPVVASGSSPAVSQVLHSPPPALPQLDITTKQHMVTTLSSATAMNLLWSEKCLNETNWNYDQAMFAFTKLHKAGSIPPDAFIK